MANFKPCAIKLENKNELKATTSNTKRFLAISSPASQAPVSSKLFWPGVAKDRPTNTATVNKELTLTRPSRAVTCILVVPLFRAFSNSSMGPSENMECPAIPTLGLFAGLQVQCRFLQNGF
eukprot:Gb_29321 [translate_table: standard]